MDVRTIGLGIFSCMVIIGLCSYFLGKRKTNAPVKAGLMGFVFSIIPALGIVYLVYLVVKQDINQAE